MTAEQCDECGFDSEKWTDDQALAAVADLPARWRDAVSGLDAESVDRRPIPAMWSIGEYTDHVRETVFGMRFVLDIAVADPGTVLGDPPAREFDHEPRHVELAPTIAAFDREILGLCDRVVGLRPSEWDSTVTIGNDLVDPRWMIRHALHDVTHHLGDVARLRCETE